MKKVFSLFCLLLLSTVAVFCQSTVAGIDSNTLLGIGATIVGALLGHFAIPSKWASPIKYALLISKGLTWLLSKANNTNTGEKATDKVFYSDIQPGLQPPTVKGK